MAFLGSIKPQAKSLIAEAAPTWAGLPIYSGCSGNFTQERILYNLGFRDIRSCDISLYSGLIGSFLCGRPMPRSIKDRRYDFLAPYLDDPLDAIATVAILMEWSKFLDKSAVYYQRMSKAYLDNFAAIHAKTRDKYNALLNYSITDYYNGDVMDFLQAAPTEAVFVSFPPINKGDYESQYRKIDDIIDWPRPSYNLFDQDALSRFLELIQRFRYFMISWDNPLESFKQFHTASIQTSAHTRPMFIYSNTPGLKRLSLFEQKTEPLLVDRLGPNDNIEPPLAFFEITQPQMNTLRCDYLTCSIVPAPAMVNFAVVCGGKLIGAVAYSFHKSGKWCDCYGMTDFSIGPTKYKNLSKLVLMASLSTEMQTLLNRRLGRIFRTVGTTAFTDNQVSMKYRGLYDLVKREPRKGDVEGFINYRSKIGRWSLSEGLKLWTQKWNQT